MLHAGRTPRADAAVVDHAARGGRGDHGQDGDHRVRQLRRRARRAIRTIRSTRPAAPPAARRPRWPRAWCRSRSAARPTARSIRPGRVLRRVRLQADARADPAHRRCSSSRARSTTSGCSRGRIDDIALLPSSCRATTRAIPTRGRARACRSATLAAEEPPRRADVRVRQDAALGARRRRRAEAFGELVEALGDRWKRSSCAAGGRGAGTGTAPSWKPRWRPTSSASGERGRDKLSDALRALIERGREVRAVDYQRALRQRCRCSTRASTSCSSSATTRSSRRRRPGTAPEGLGSTGDPTFCTLWTLLGMPAVTPAADAGRQRPAARRAARRPAPLRRAAAAHRALARRAAGG